MREFDEFSWAVGIFEGEGHISCLLEPLHRAYYRVRLYLNMTDRDVVERFSKVFPGGNLYILSPQENRKQVYRYAIQKRNTAEQILLEMQPYFSDKKSLECKRALILIKEARSRPSARVK